jgi:signal transduction histidine kinase
LDRGSIEPEAASASEPGAGARAPAGVAADASARMARLQAVTAALSRARTPDEVADVALDAGIAALGGARGFLLVPSPGGDMQVLRSAGVPETCVGDAARRGPSPAWDAFRAGVPVFVADRAAAGRWGLRCGSGRGCCGEALAALPLVTQGRSLGVLVVRWDGPCAFSDVDRDLAAAVADASAQALDRARLLVAERLARAEAVSAQRRIAFLDEISVHLAATLEEPGLLDGVVRRAVPAIGDWAGVLVAGERGLERAAEAGPRALGDEVEAALRAPPSAPLAHLDPEGAPALVDARGAEPLDPRAAIVAPLAVGGRVLGALVVASADPLRRYGPADLALAAAVARRTALALDHARLLRDARSAASAREEFLHVASHELRGPLGALRLSVQLLLRDARAGGGRPPESRLLTIDRQANRLARLAEMLLDVSRITAGRLELSVEDVDLGALVREVVARHAEEAADGRVGVCCRERPPIRCRVDPARFEQVLRNLLSNAVKYGEGKPVEVRLEDAGGVVRLAVADLGIGIAPEDQARIFGRFERAVSGRHYTGLGLGLWIVRELVEAHGGAIRVESLPGEGSTFFVELPVCAQMWAGTP